MSAALFVYAHFTTPLGLFRLAGFFSTLPRRGASRCRPVATTAGSVGDNRFGVLAPGPSGFRWLFLFARPRLADTGQLAPGPLWCQEWNAAGPLRTFPRCAPEVRPFFCRLFLASTPLRGQFPPEPLPPGLRLLTNGEILVS